MFFFNQKSWINVSFDNVHSQNQAEYLSRLRIMKRRVSVNDNDCRSLKDSSRLWNLNSKICWIKYIWKTVLFIYYKICCDSDFFINDWYANLKKTAEISTYQEMKNIRDWYKKMIHSLIKIKNYKRWITK